MSKLVNVTRVSEDIPARLRAEGKAYLVPVYHLLRMSELGREGIEHNGSFRFADHIYGGQAKGVTLLGKALDWVLLKLPSARSFRNRYLYSLEELRRVVAAGRSRSAPLDLLAVPSGLAREMFDIAREIAGDRELTRRTTLHFIDLDEEPLALVRKGTAEIDLRTTIIRGDALDSRTYQGQKYDAIVSLGFAEFLDDNKTLDFFRLARTLLKPGGKLITSGLMPHRLSDYLMRQFAELHTSYRSRAELLELAEQAGFTRYEARTDGYGLQTLLVCTHEQDD